MQAHTRALLISLAGMILLSLLNWGIISDWGNVKIKRIEQIGDDGSTYTALLYVPQSATNDSPAPAIYMVHGGSGNARNHESWCMELSRRGYVCLAVDYFGGGNADNPNTAGATDISTLPKGIHEQFVRYLLNMPIVDENQFLTAGHSLGCDSAAYIAENWDARGCMVYGGSANHVIPFIQMAYGTGEYTTLEAQLTNFVKSAQVNGFPIENTSDVEIGQLYGSFESGKAMRFVNIDRMRHEAPFFHTGAIYYLLDFAQQALERTADLAPNNQIWMWKEVIGLFGIISYVVCLINFALFLIEDTKVFSILKQPLPRNIGLRGVGLIISYAAAIIFPLIILRTGAFGLVKILTDVKSTIFRLGVTKHALMYTLGMALLGCIMLVLYIFTEGKKQKATIRDLGLTIDGSTTINGELIWKSLLLAVLVICAGQAFLTFQSRALGTEFYCIIFSAKEIPMTKIRFFTPYVLIWLPCFVVTAISLNVERRLPSTGSENLDTLIACSVNALMNCLVITIVIIIQNYIQVRTQGSGAYTFQDWGIEICRTWGMPAMTAIAGAGQTYVYRKTGHIWLSAFLLALFCSIIACCGGSTMVMSFAINFKR